MAERDQSKNKNPALNPDQRMKKRGRPPTVFSHSTPRGRGRGRAGASSSTGMLNNEVSHETGTGFVPHSLRVNIGEDLIEKVSEFAKRSSQTICVLSAEGCVSSVVFRKPGAPITDTVKWEGRFQIMSLSGKYTYLPGEDESRIHNWWNLSLSDNTGAVFGGSVVGPIIVATPVDLILASFKLKSTERTRRHAAAADFSHAATGSETVSDKSAMVGGKTDRGSPTSGLSPSTGQASESVTPKTADKTSESVTPKTTDKAAESVTSPMKGHAAGSYAVADYSIRVDIDLEKLPDGDVKEEGEKQSVHSPTLGLVTTDKSPESVTAETTDTTQEELSSETVDKPAENATAATSDKPAENVTRATTSKSAENAFVLTSDASSPVMACYFNRATKDVPFDLNL